MKLIHFFLLLSATIEVLPTPSAQVGYGPEGRNYVAYIPVPMSGDEDDQGDYFYDDQDYLEEEEEDEYIDCLLYTSPSPRD